MRLASFFAFLFLALPFTASAATSPACTANTLIKGSLDAVYYCGINGKRYAFPTLSTFQSWYADFSGVISVSDAALATIPLGGSVTYRPGVTLLKVTTDPKVYAVDQKGTLRWVTSESIAASLYGQNWALYVRDLPDVFFANYHVGTAIVAVTDFSPALATSSATTIGVDLALTAPPMQAPTSPTATSTPPTATSTPQMPPAQNQGFSLFIPEDGPKGSSSPSTEAVVGKFVVSNSPGDATVTIRSLNVYIGSTISNTAPRTVSIYRDAVSPSTRLATMTTCTPPAASCAFAATNFAVGSMDTDVGPGTSRTFFVTADTTDARTNDTLTVSVPSGGLHWSDGITPDIAQVDHLPLAGNTLRY